MATPRDLSTKTNGAYGLLNGQPKGENMKTKWLLIGIALGFALGWLWCSNAQACNTGCVPYEEGVCVCDPPTETYKFAPTPTSDEKPPTDKMPSYQRAGIHADMPSVYGVGYSTPTVSDSGLPKNGGVPERKK